MKQAAKFNRPIICFVDTPGAFPGMEAEERGQGEAIARNLFEMSDMKVPILAIITGQGGSGGALALWRYYFVAKKQFGGITGDLAGWFLQRAELWMLAALAVSQWGGVL